jgi:polysaccharide deacetylase 2 family uncharacterized protein YibQ
MHHTDASPRNPPDIDRQRLHRLTHDRVRRVVERVQIDRPGAAHDVAAELQLVAEDAQRHGAAAIGALALEGIEASRRWAADLGADDARVDVARTAAAILRELGLRL